MNPIFPADRPYQVGWNAFIFNHDCIENPDEYGVDLLVDGKGRKFGCEVEVKTGWHGTEFNYPILRIPFRKKKFTKGRVTFFVLNNARIHAAVVSRQKLLKSPVVQVKNKMVPIGDYFYEIALENVEFVNLLAGNKNSRVF